MDLEYLIPNKKNVLLSPLYWGMGHTTRLVPVIRECIQKNNIVYLAGNQHQLSFYRKLFGETAQYLFLESPEIVYGNSRRHTQWQLVRQLPNWKKSLAEDNQSLQKWQKELGLDWVISDARMGLHSPHLHSVLINHQINPISNLGKWADHLLKINADKLMKLFDEFWVPDEKERPLAGQLSRIVKGAASMKYIGWLTHLESRTFTPQFEFLWMLSGPQPQRSIFEKEAREFFAKTKYSGYIVGGKKSEDGTGLGLLSSHELSELLPQCKSVVTRSGYSTLMDLTLYPEMEVFLSPTPGQAEQEYLYRYHTNKGKYKRIDELENI